MRSGRLFVFAAYIFLESRWTLRLEGIDDLEKRKSVEVCISGVDSPDAMFPHEDGSMRIMEEIAGKVRQLREDLSCHLGVPLRRDKDAEPRGLEKNCDELPSPRYFPWPAHHSGVSRHAQEFIKDSPGSVPGIGAAAPIFQPGEAGGMKGRVFIGGVDQNVGIDDQH
jgi:hypothetical protein